MMLRSLNHEYMPSSVDLHQALRARNMAMVIQLSKTGMDVNVPLRGTTALSLAVYLGLEEAVGLLLRHGANVNQTSRDHLDRLEPPLYTACRLGCTGIVRILLEFNADVNKTDWYGQSPLWAAVRENRIDLVHLLLNNGAHLGRITQYHECPLFLATKYLLYGRRDIAMLLVYSGCNPNCADSNGCTSLYWVLKFQDYELATLLIMAGAQVNMKWNLATFLEPKGVWFQWLHKEQTHPPSLQRSCRTFIRSHLISSHPGSVCTRIDELPLPSRLKSYLKLVSL